MTETNNRNLLSPNKFRIVVDRFPNVQLFTQRLPIPTATLGSTTQYTNQEADIKVPGDKVEYEDLIISIIIDEDFEGPKEVIKWMQECAASGDHKQFYSMITIYTLTNNLNKNVVFKFHNSFPQVVSNTLLDATASEDQPLTLDVIFKYSHFTIE